jgi:hypothetical protein
LHYGITVTPAQLPNSPAGPRRVVAVKRLRRSSAALRSLWDGRVGAVERFPIKAFGARNRLRRAGPRRARFIYGAPSQGIEVIIFTRKDYSAPCCVPKGGL